MRPQKLLLLCSLFVGCDPYVVDPGPASNSRILREMREGSEAHFSNEGLLNAAFVFLGGKNRAEAIAFLSTDGFECSQTICSAVRVEREMFKAGIRGPGPLKIFTTTYDISFVSDDILSPSDINVVLKQTLELIDNQ